MNKDSSRIRYRKPKTKDAYVEPLSSILPTALGSLSAGEWMWQVMLSAGFMLQGLGFLIIGVSLLMILFDYTMPPTTEGRVANLHNMFEVMMTFLTGTFLCIYGRLLQMK